MNELLDFIREVDWRNVYFMALTVLLVYGLLNPVKEATSTISWTEKKSRHIPLKIKATLSKLFRKRN